jgi:hypothetical protein
MSSYDITSFTGGRGVDAIHARIIASVFCDLFYLLASRMNCGRTGEEFNCLDFFVTGCTPFLSS